MLVRELEVEATHFRDRTARAEEWLLRIHNEVENSFFQKNDSAPAEGRGSEMLECRQCG
jgi:hypothetical protein